MSGGQGPLARPLASYGTAPGLVWHGSWPPDTDAGWATAEPYLEGSRPLTGAPVVLTGAPVVLTGAPVAVRAF